MRRACGAVFDESGICRTIAVAADPSPSEPFDRERELEFARGVLAGRKAAVVEFEDRVRCVPRILRALNRRRGAPLGDHDLADLAQDTIMIVLRKLDQYEAWVPFEGWVYRLCFLELLNAIRRRGRDQQRTTELIEDHDTAASHPPAAAHEYDDVYVGLEKLGGVEAEVIRLKWFENLTFPELAERLAMPLSTAKSRYFRGMTKLEELIRTYRKREERSHDEP